MWPHDSFPKRPRRGVPEGDIWLIVVIVGLLLGMALLVNVK